METITLLIVILSAHFLAVISPGPDFFMVVKNALMYSRKTGIYTAIGLGLGIATHIIYSMAGVALIISKSVVIFNILKILGAVYLIYLGWQTWKSKPGKAKSFNEERKNDISIKEALKIGFLTNVLNPKATLFFLSLFTVIIPADTSSGVIALVSFFMVVNTSLWFVFVATFFTQEKVRVLYTKSENVVNKIFGTVLIGLGVKVATTE